jgi:hypothetical protein
MGNLTKTAETVAINMKIEEIRDHWGTNLRTILLSKQDLPQVISCSEKRCHGGGILVDDNLLREVIEGDKKQAKVCKACQGQERTPKSFRKCTHFFEITVYAQGGNS